MLIAALLTGICFSQSWLNRQGKARDDASFSDQALTTGENDGLRADAGFGEPNDADTSSDESRAIEVARNYINQQSHTLVEATYRAKRTNDGYRVFVEYMKGYNEEGGPLPLLGGHCVLEISKDWQVSSVVLAR